MYIPIVSDYYQLLQSARFFFSENGRGIGAALGIFLGVTLGLPLAVLKTVLDGIAHAYQGTVTGLRRLSVVLAPLSPVRSDKFDFQKNHFIGHWFMALTTIGIGIIFLGMLAAPSALIVWVQIHVIASTGLLAILVSFIALLIVAASWVTFINVMTRGSDYSPFFTIPAAIILGLPALIAGVIFFSAAYLFAAVVSLAMTLILYIPHKIMDALSLGWMILSDRFDHFAAFCFTATGRCDEHYTSLLPEAFVIRLSRHDQIRSNFSRGESDDPDVYGLEARVRGLESRILNEQHRGQFNMILKNNALTTTTQKRLQPYLVPDVQLIIVSFLTTTPALATPSLTTRTPSESDTLLRTYEFFVVVSGFKTVGFNQYHQYSAACAWMHYDKHYDDRLTRHKSIQRFGLQRKAIKNDLPQANDPEGVFASADNGGERLRYRLSGLQRTIEGQHLKLISAEDRDAIYDYIKSHHPAPLRPSFKP